MVGRVAAMRCSFSTFSSAGSTLQAELPRLMPFLRRPDVHLGMDPEFAMGDSDIPGRRIGKLNAADVNAAVDILADLVTSRFLPPKVLIVHRFTRDMLHTPIASARSARADRDQHGWLGTARVKRESYRRYVTRYPVEYTGFKLFYRNDTKAGDRLMTPAQVLALFPRPLYIQYQ